MMINANTSTRTFRELQFDLHAFLVALYELFPVDGQDDKGLVEVKWSDGSVDVVPTFELIRGICDSSFGRLIIGDSAELVPGVLNGMPSDATNYRDELYLLINSVPLKANMPSIGDASTDIEFVGGVIVSLVADTVSLPDGVTVSELTVTGNLSTGYCEVAENLESNGEFYAEDGKVSTLDVSGMDLTQPVRVYTPNSPIYDLSQYSYITDLSDIKGMYRVSGLFRYGDTYDADTQRRFNEYGACVVVEVPVLSDIINGELVYDYMESPKENYPEDYTRPFPAYSISNLVMLYPLKQTRSTNRYGTMYVRLLPPSEEDIGKIINVRNVTDGYITVSNVWSFGMREYTSVRKSTSSPAWLEALGISRESRDISTVGDVTSLNTVTLPPYSSIDFLFGWDVRSGKLTAYMQPMTSLNLKYAGV